MIIRPMLGASLPENVTPEELDYLVPYPVLATIKFDGIRTQRINDIVYSGRDLKPLRNNYINQKIEAECIGELDGETVTYEDGVTDEFNTVQSKVMSINGEPDFKYHVFDCITTDLHRHYLDRIDDLEKMQLPVFCEKVIPTLITNVDELLEFEGKCLEHTEQNREGHEGVMLRTIDSPYKCGRSTLKQFWLVKLVRYASSEAIVLDVYEQLTNTNEATLLNTGYTKRRKTIDGGIGNGKLGGFIVRDCYSGEEFKVGCGKGMTDKMRYHLWETRDNVIGKMITYKYKPYGRKNAPRQPVWKGFRYDKGVPNG